MYTLTSVTRSSSLCPILLTTLPELQAAYQGIPLCLSQGQLFSILVLKYSAPSLSPFPCGLISSSPHLSPRRLKQFLISSSFTKFFSLLILYLHLPLQYNNMIMSFTISKHLSDFSKLGYIQNFTARNNPFISSGRSFTTSLHCKLAFATHTSPLMPCPLTSVPVPGGILLLYPL